MMLLADTSNAALVMSGVGIVIEIVLAFVVFGLTRTVQKFDRQEDRSNQVIADIKKEGAATVLTLEAQLHATTEKLIDDRFRVMTHQLNGHAQAFMNTLDEMKDRLKTGDAQLDGLVNSDHQIELKMRGCLDQIKDWIREYAASKQDLKEHEKHVSHKFDLMGAQVIELGKEVAVLTDRARIVAK